jgi:hypothetical protein
MYKEDPFDLSKLYGLSFSELKSVTRLGIHTHFNQASRSDLLTSLCAHFHIEDGIGVCGKQPLVCPSFDCDYIDVCKQECITYCPVNNAEYKFFYECPSEITSAIEGASQMIDYLVAQLPNEVVVTALTDIAEGSSLEALIQHPYEFLIAFKIREWLNNKYGRFDSYKYDISLCERYHKQVDRLWECFLTFWVLQEYKAKIDNKDAVLALSAGGQKILSRLKEDPTCLMRYEISQMRKMVKEKRKPSPKYLTKLFWTRQMIPVLSWCKSNSFSVDLRGMSIQSQYLEVEKTWEAAANAGTGRKLHLAEDVRLGLPLYGALFHMSRFVISHCAQMRDVIAEYDWLPKYIDSELGFSLDHRLWDRTLLVLKNRVNATGPLQAVTNTVSDSILWPIFYDGKVLLASAILLGFVVYNQRDILARNYESGVWFEDVIEQELKSREIPIMARNIELPRGEIDFICLDSVNSYVLETKDYGPRGKLGYFSSKEYCERNLSLADYLDKFVERIAWVHDNRNRFDISHDSKIYGIYVSSYKEPHVKIPGNITAIPITRLCGIFGGEPVDPILKLQALKSGGSSTENVPERSDFKPQPHTVVDDEFASKVGKFASDRIEQIFHDIYSFQLYRIAWEVYHAINENAFAVMEISAVPHGRPKKLTKQYLIFIAHRADSIPIAEIHKSYSNLIALNLLKEDETGVCLGQDIPTEFWQLDSKCDLWHRVETDAEADLILFLHSVQEMEEHRKLATFVDAIYGHPRTMILFKERKE